MSIKKAKSFNGQVYEKSYKRLNLNPIERLILQRLLGFLIRNNKPFPFSVVSMSELTGYSKSTIFRAINKLENLRLIIRIGEGNNRRFGRGTIMDKILTTVSNRPENNQHNNLTTVSDSDKLLNNRVRVTYKKTSLSLKPKESEFFESQENPKPNPETYRRGTGAQSINAILEKLRL